MEELASQKEKRCLVEPCWWGTHNSPHFLLIPFPGKFQACQRVFSRNFEKYWISQFHWSRRIKHVESHGLMNEKLTLNVLTLPNACQMCYGRSSIKRHFLHFQCLSLGVLCFSLRFSAHSFLAFPFCLVKATISHIRERTTCQIPPKYVQWRLP